MDGEEAAMAATQVEPAPATTLQVMDAFDTTGRFIGTHEDDGAMALLT